MATRSPINKHTPRSVRYRKAAATRRTIATWQPWQRDYVARQLSHKTPPLAPRARAKFRFLGIPVK